MSVTAMVGSIRIGMVIAGFAALAVSEPAQAADAYLCGPDNVVYVEVADLERMKRTDPCIAGYYGLKVEAVAPPAVRALEPVVPKSKPVRRAPVIAPEFKSLTQNDVPARASGRAALQASLKLPATTAPGTDFRNVRVLNAQSPESAWFHHAR